MRGALLSTQYTRAIRQRSSISWTWLNKHTHSRTTRSPSKQPTHILLTCIISVSDECVLYILLHITEYIYIYIIRWAIVQTNRGMHASQTRRRNITILLSPHHFPYKRMHCQLYRKLPAFAAGQQTFAWQRIRAFEEIERLLAHIRRLQF